MFLPGRLNKNANLTQFKKQRGRRSHFKWDHFYSCHICLGHGLLIFKYYFLWELNFQDFVAMKGFKFQILPCVKISFQSVCPRRIIIDLSPGIFFKWTFFRGLFKYSLFSLLPRHQEVSNDAFHFLPNSVWLYYQITYYKQNK